jgi:methyl coenzyme M reductase gamma subunit
MRCRYRRTRRGFAEFEPYVRCRKGKHKYRGLAEGTASPPRMGRTVVSVKEKKYRC